MASKDDINARGLAKGWHAEQLLAEAKQNGETMAECHARKVENSSAFSVPALCTKVTSAWVHYEFLDGSTTKYPNQGK